MKRLLFILALAFPLLAATTQPTAPANSVDSTSIKAQAVTLAKIVNATAQGKLIGRSTASTGSWEEVAADKATLTLPAGGALKVINEPFLCNGRLTLQTGVAVSTSDQTAKSTLYFTPYKGDRIALYDGTNWQRFTFSELSLALTLTTGKNYDVFVYSNAGTPTLALSAAWANDTTRTDALALQNGVYIKNGATGYRYVGSIRASNTNKTEDSAANRLVWNYYNRTLRALKVVDTTDNWIYTTATWRSANNSTANRVTAVVGIAESLVQLEVNALWANTNAGVNAGVGIGIGVTNANNADVPQLTNAQVANYFTTTRATLRYQQPAGFQFYQWTEYSQAVGTTTWYGDNGAPTLIQSGMVGTLDN